MTMNVDKGYVDSPVDKDIDLKAEILRLKKEKGAVILAHYYQKGEIQDIADYIGDSLALAQIASRLTEPIIVLCEVNFRGEPPRYSAPTRRCLFPTSVPAVRLPTVAKPMSLRNS